MIRLSDVVAEVAKRVDSEVEEAQGFVTEALEVVIDALNRGEDVSLWGFGTFKWVPVPARKLYGLVNQGNTVVAKGYKLKFHPASPFTTRRSSPNVRPRRGNDKARGRTE